MEPTFLGTPGSVCTGQRWQTYPEGALGHVDAAPGDDDSMFNGLGRHVGAAEGTVAIGDHLDVDGAAICILWVPTSQAMFMGAEKATGISVRPLLDQADSARLYSNQYLHPPTQGPATEASTTCFGGQCLPREPKELA